jgi:glycolate oxidase
MEEVVIDLSFLNRVVHFDPSIPAVTVQAGTRWADVDAFLQERGLALYTYPSSYYSSVGGWIATGGLGINSLRFGHLKDHVLSMRAVFPSGEMRELLPSDAWFDRFFGTEGQLGLIAQVSLRVRRRPEGTYPVLLSFEGDGEAFEWIRSMMQKGTRSTHVKFMGPHLIDEINRFYGETLIEAKPSVLAVFEEDRDRDRLDTVPGSQAPEYLARFLWHERLFPLRMSVVGSRLLASETLLADRATARYVEGIRRLAGHMGFELLVEAHAIEPQRLLLMPHLLCQPDRKLRYFLALVLTSLLTQAAVNQGGVPYGLGIWNSPFIGNRFDVQAMRVLRGWKDQVDPDHRFNPSRYFQVGTRFFNIPGQAFRPWIFQFWMKVLIATAPVWGRVMRLFTSGKPARIKALTPMEKAALLCSNCGSCLSVCPAYRVRKDEALTARSKLRVIRKISDGNALSPEEATKVFLCLHCHACERVCQSRLGLVEAWEDLEKKVAGTHGFPKDAISEFIKDTDASDEYGRMVDNW